MVERAFQIIKLPIAGSGLSMRCSNLSGGQLAQQELAKEVVVARMAVAQGHHKETVILKVAQDRCCIAQISLAGRLLRHQTFADCRRQFAQNCRLAQES